MRDGIGLGKSLDGYGVGKEMWDGGGDAIA